METTKRRFIGANIKSNPVMPQSAVRHDLKVVEYSCDAGVLQEFKVSRYWLAFARSFGKGWSTYPIKKKGLRRPVLSGQPNFWFEKLWEAKAHRVRLLHNGKAKISESRYLRATLLSDRETGLREWIGGTHFVVGGDEDTDGRIRQDMLNENIDDTADFIRGLKKTGHPVLFELDANIRKSSDSFDEFKAAMTDLGARFYGEKGVEYLMVIQGDDVEVVVVSDFTIPVSRIRTDHEMRGVIYFLRRK